MFVQAYFISLYKTWINFMNNTEQKNWYQREAAMWQCIELQHGQTSLGIQEPLSGWLLWGWGGKMGQDNARRGVLETTAALLPTLGVGCTCVLMEEVSGGVTV